MKINHLKTFDGTKLAYIDMPIKNAKYGVILIHGLAEHSGRYHEFITRLNDAGISVFALDLRGHGRSDGRRGDVNSFDDYLMDLDLFIRHIKNKNPKLKLILFGHSIGGLIATNYVAQSNLIDMLILSSPSFETPLLVHLLRAFPTKVFGKIKIKKRVSESAEMLAYNRSDPYACRHFTVGVLKHVFVDGVKRSRKNFSSVSIPVLMIGGRGDPLVNSGKFESLLGQFNCTDKTMIIYENAKHRIVQNAAKDVAIPDIINWIKSK